MKANDEEDLEAVLNTRASAAEQVSSEILLYQDKFQAYRVIPRRIRQFSIEIPLLLDDLISPFQFLIPSFQLHQSRCKLLHRFLVTI